MKDLEFYIYDYSLEHLNFHGIGEQYCAPGHFNGPKVRENIIFHFIFSGKGIFQTHGKTYELGANQGFVISDSSPVFYKADEIDPWHYGWIHFTGKTAQKILEQLSLSPQHPIYTANPNNNIYKCFKELLQDQSRNNYYHNLSSLFSYISALINNNIHYSSNSIIEYKDAYVQKAIKYILHNYHSSLHIGDLASYIGIDRSYLTRLFVEKTGKSPQQYLLDLRMEKAKVFLQTTDYMIKTIAQSVGYDNIEAFSKIYKKHHGISPSQTRKQGKSK